MSEKVIIGNATLILGDCREILPTLPRVDAVVTDPPYGINRDGKPPSTSSHGGHKGYEFFGWDRSRPSKDVFAKILKSSDVQVIWGGNYFADLLPASGKWFFWDKGQRISQADGELAWTSLYGAMRVFTINRKAIDRDGAVHPTQKPLPLMKWCIEQLPAHAHTILDPYMGSGTTGVACAQMGRAFIGIEIDPRYFEIACRRIEAAQAQPDMFIETAPMANAEQLGLELPA